MKKRPYASDDNIFAEGRGGGAIFCSVHSRASRARWRSIVRQPMHVPTDHIPLFSSGQEVAVLDGRVVERQQGVHGFPGQEVRRQRDLKKTITATTTTTNNCDNNDESNFHQTADNRNPECRIARFNIGEEAPVSVFCLRFSHKQSPSRRVYLEH